MRQTKTISSVTARQDDKTRHLCGFQFDVGEFSFTAERWPAFDAFVVVSFPVRKIGSDPKERIEVESEIGFCL
jgi:hypothetical protein